MGNVLLVVHNIRIEVIIRRTSVGGFETLGGRMQGEVGVKKRDMQREEKLIAGSPGGKTVFVEVSPACLIAGLDFSAYITVWRAYSILSLSW